jgi:NAD-dependent SIR2 family protein deacetylase
VKLHHSHMTCRCVACGESIERGDLIGTLMYEGTLTTQPACLACAVLPEVVEVPVWTLGHVS